MSNIVTKLIGKLIDIVRNLLDDPKVQKALKEILWFIIDQVVDIIKNKDNEQEEEYA